MGRRRPYSFTLISDRMMTRNSRWLRFPNSARLLKFAVTLLTVMSIWLMIHIGSSSIFTIINNTQTNHHHGNKAMGFNKPSNYNVKVAYQHKLCVSFVGRLGNQMFQYASAFGISKMKNMGLRVRDKDTVAKVFNISAMKVRNKDHCSHAYQKFERFQCAYDPQLLNFSTNHDVMLLSYLQSWKYFINVSYELRHEFTFRLHVQEKAEELFYNTTKDSKYFKKDPTYIGIHIRRGDMVPQGQTKSYSVATRDYILRAMNFFLHKYPKSTFVICSDDMKWVKRQFAKYSQILRLTFVARSPAEVELAVLSLCDHIIMTTGTYSWWAAWLAGGMAVYYKNFIQEDSILRSEFSSDFSDYFYPGWIAME